MNSGGIWRQGYRLRRDLVARYPWRRICSTSLPHRQLSMSLSRLRTSRTVGSATSSARTPQIVPDALGRAVASLLFARAVLFALTVGLILAWRVAG